MRTSGSKGKGEVDVVGLDLYNDEVYFCEVATHVHGLQYTANARPANLQRLLPKFERDIEYAQIHFHHYGKHFMLWSPVVREPRSKETKYNQLRDVRQLAAIIKKRYHVTIELIVNEVYWERLQELRKVASVFPGMTDSPVVRFIQIEEHLRRHLSRRSRHSSRPRSRTPVSSS